MIKQFIFFLSVWKVREMHFHIKSKMVIKVYLIHILNTYIMILVFY